MAPSANRYVTSAVASLTRLSPSMMVTRRRGTPSFLMTAAAADASGGETIAPSRNAAGHEMPRPKARTVTATSVVVNRTRPNASRKMGRRFRLKSLHEVK